MKIAITAQGQASDSPLDSRFGRAPWIAIVNTDTGQHRAYDNAVNLKLAQGAGIQTAKRVSDLGAEAVLTGHVGPKAFVALHAAQVAVYLTDSVTVADAIESLKRGDLQPVSHANVAGHWG